MTQSQAISQSFRVFISFRSMRDTTFFHFSKLIFCTKYRFFYHGNQKMSWWCRWRAVNFEIHLWSSGMNADCIWRSISMQHVQIEAGLNSDPGNDSFWVESVTLSMLIDLLTSRCRSTQVKLYTGLIASIDLWLQEMFIFSEMLALVQSESSFCAFVCYRRPAGLQATSDLVQIVFLSPRILLLSLSPTVVKVEHYCRVCDRDMAIIFKIMSELWPVRLEMGR